MSPMSADDTAARAEAERQAPPEEGDNEYATECKTNWQDGFVYGARWQAQREPTEAEIEAGAEAYERAFWPAYSAAVRAAPSNQRGQGISSDDAARAGFAGRCAGVRAALIAARGDR